MLALAAEGGGPDGGSGSSSGDTAAGSPGSAPTATGEQPGSSGDGEASAARADDEESDDALSAMVASFTGGAVTGSGLIWVLLAMTLVVAMVAWVSFRRAHSSGGGADSD